MHSCIYQIMHSTDCERISESNFYDHLDDIPADYVSDLNETDEDDYIKALPNFLPKSMFKCKGREITFLGPDKELIEEWKRQIHEKVESCTTSAIASGDITWGYLWGINKAVNNCLDVDCRFFFDDDGYAMKSTDFILCCLHLTPGEKLYVGAVIDYHF